MIFDLVRAGVAVLEALDGHPQSFNDGVTTHVTEDQRIGVRRDCRHGFGFEHPTIQEAFVLAEVREREGEIATTDGENFDVAECIALTDPDATVVAVLGGNAPLQFLDTVGRDGICGLGDHLGEIVNIQPTGKDATGLARALTDQERFVFVDDHRVLDVFLEDRDEIGGIFNQAHAHRDLVGVDVSNDRFQVQLDVLLVGILRLVTPRSAQEADVSIGVPTIDRDLDRVGIRELNNTGATTANGGTTGESLRDLGLDIRGNRESAELALCFDLCGFDVGNRHPVLREIEDLLHREHHRLEGFHFIAVQLVLAVSNVLPERDVLFMDLLTIVRTDDVRQDRLRLRLLFAKAKDVRGVD